jgi:hypothetical protein
MQLAVWGSQAPAPGRCGLFQPKLTVYYLFGF